MAANGRTTQERVVTSVTQTSNVRTTQERVTTGVTQTSNARVCQERVVIAYVPGVFTGLGNFAGKPAHTGFASESFPGYSI